MSKRNQFTMFAAIVLLSIVIIGALVIVGKNNAATSNNPQASQLPLLDLSDKQQLINGIQQASATPAATQEAGFPGAIEIDASASASSESAKRVKVTLTNGRTFTLALYSDLAPKTVTNFLNKVHNKVYDGLLFFRVEKDKEGNSALVQTGDPTNTGQGGGVIQAEYNKKPFSAGSLGIARGQNRDKNSDSQFFVVAQDLAQLNGEYTNFGDVISGLDVVSQIKQGQPILTVREIAE